MFKIKVKSIAYELLLVLGDLGELFPWLFETPFGYTNRIRNYNSGQVSNGLSYLRRQGLVRSVGVYGQKSWLLTPKGKSILQQKSRFVTKRHDNQSLIIIFDIPETKKKARDVFRKALKVNGFRLMQKSVFEGKFQLTQSFVKLIKDLDIFDHVTVIEGRIV
jgi:DNA-binding transcriptional regulator PaaX